MGVGETGVGETGVGETGIPRNSKAHGISISNIPKQQELTSPKLKSKKPIVLKSFTGIDLTLVE